MAKERILIDVPDWVELEEAGAEAGTRYWRLKKLKYLDAHASGGLHHIFSMEPHDADVALVLSNGQQTWTVPHDKPESEPAANFAMWAKNEYTVWVNGHGVEMSDRVAGFQMPLKHHVVYQLWWELVEAEDDDGDGTSGDGEVQDLPTALIDAAEVNQVIQFNPDAALQQAIFADGLVPNSSEFRVTVAGDTYIGQRAEHLGTGEVRVYFVQEGDWANVQHVVRSDVDD